MRLPNIEAFYQGDISKNFPFPCESAEWIQFNRLVERKFCNDTVPEVNIYWLEDGLWGERHAEDTSAYSDKFPGKTEVSIYYTSGVRPQTTDTFVPWSEITGTTDPETSAPETFIRTSTFAVTPTVDLPGATSTGAAGELKAAGGGGYAWRPGYAVIIDLFLHGPVVEKSVMVNQKRRRRTISN